MVFMTNGGGAPCAPGQPINIGIGEVRRQELECLAVRLSQNMWTAPKDVRRYAFFNIAQTVDIVFTHMRATIMKYGCHFM